MAAIIPSHFKWKANYNQRYLRLHDENIQNQDGILEFTGEDSSRIFTIEASTNNPEYVHIKHSVTKFYLAGARIQPGANLRIVATADRPNENVIDKNCTLFELFKPDIAGPANATQGVFLIRHVQSTLYLRPQTVDGLDAALYAVSSNRDRFDVDLFTLTWT